MEAPREIYLNKANIDKLPEDGIMGDSWHRKPGSYTSIKYIRADKAVDKEALMEFLGDKLCHLSADGIASGIARLTIQTIIDKINKL